MTLFFLRKLLEDSRDGKYNLENPLREDPRLITVSQDQRESHPPIAKLENRGFTRVSRKKVDP